MMARLKKIIGALSLFFFCLNLVGCNREAGHRLLRTFFDGVPPLEEAKPVVKGKKEEGRKKTAIDTAAEGPPTVFFHPPFLENQCNSCHDQKYSQKLILEGKELCFTCHDDFTKGKKVIHYPVSEGSCTECHDPHQSSRKRLLKQPMPEICFTCHDKEEIRKNPAHEGGQACVQCHNPHASDEEKLLK